jgi:hypothetical protein
MATVLYKDFIIIAGADVDKTTGRWVPIACVNWGTAKGKTGRHFLTQSEERYIKADDAVECGIKIAKTWVDRRVNRDLDDLGDFRQVRVKALARS